MKIVDKIYCIKDRPLLFADNLNTKGKIYSVLGFKDNEITVSCDKNIYHICAHFKYNKKTKYYDDCYHFEDYFYSIKEYRKLKLKKLKNV